MAGHENTLGQKVKHLAEGVRPQRRQKKCAETTVLPSTEQNLHGNLNNQLKLLRFPSNPSSTQLPHLRTDIGENTVTNDEIA
jgi:hypothetical protein